MGAITGPICAFALGIFLTVSCGSSSDGGSGGAGGTASVGLSCPEYCDAIMASCTGGNAQYSSQSVCLAVCAAFAVGTAGDKSGDTLACRATHTALAKSDPAVHCSHAGPAGDGTCGANCDGYCDIMNKYCPSAYAGLDDCKTKCGGITGASAKGFDVGTTTGDSLFCRIYHASAASTDATLHCPHAQLVPTAACK